VIYFYCSCQSIATGISSMVTLSVCDRGAGQYFILTMGNLSIGEVWALYLSVKEAVQIVNGNFICQQKEAVQIVNGHFICLQKEAVQIVNGHFICMRKKLFILSMGT
jgi:hypothetical protein